LKVLVLVCICGCGDGFEQDTGFPIKVDYQATGFQGNACQVRGTLSNLSRDNGFSLIWASILLESAQGDVYQAVFDAPDLQVSSPPAFVSALGRVDIQLSIAIPPAKVGQPLSGSIQVMGSHLRKLAIFEGHVKCE